jgi:hypothetical protein
VPATVNGTPSVCVPIVPIMMVPVGNLGVQSGMHGQKHLQPHSADFEGDLYPSG